MFDLEQSLYRRVIKLHQIPALLKYKDKTLKAINLPNASLCADFLANKHTQEWIGITIAVSPNDLEVMHKLCEKVCPSIGVFVYPHSSNSIYSNFPEWNWLEIRWSNTLVDWLIPVQTNGAIWFEGEMKLRALVLEDIDYLIQESGEKIWLSPKLFQVPEMNV